MSPKNSSLRKIQAKCFSFLAVLILSFSTLFNPTFSPNVLAANGDVYNWGNTYFYDAYAPVKMKQIDNVKDMSFFNNRFLFAKNDGTVWTWGFNSYIGDGTSTTANTTPTQVPGLSGINQVAAGGNFSLALKNDGTVWAWGDNFSGELGDGSFNSNYTPTQITGLSNIAFISAGGNHAGAVDASGNLFTWGANFAGQLGRDTSPDTYGTTPGQVTSLSNIDYIFLGGASQGGGDFTFAVQTNGTLWAFGDNADSIFTTDSSTLPSTETPYQTSITGVDEVEASCEGGAGCHVIALKTNGTVWTWGANSAGQLGDGTFDSSVSPIQVSGITGAIEVEASQLSSYAVVTGGTVKAWGDNFEGRLGVRDLLNRYKTTPTDTMTITGVTELEGWLNSTTAVVNAIGAANWNASTPDRVLAYWGSAVYQPHGATGTGVAAELGGIDDIAQFDTYDNDILIAKNDGTVWMVRGYDGSGVELQTAGNTPQQVPGLSNIIDVASGKDHYMALKNDGTVWVWGFGTFGRLGLGNTNDSWSPTQIPGLSNITKIYAFAEMSAAIDSSGNAWTWGYSDDGALGRQTDGNPNCVTIDGYCHTPGQVTAASNVTKIAGGGSAALSNTYTIFLNTTGNLAIVGSNSTGIFGDGLSSGNAFYTEPVILQIGTLIDVAGGDNHAIAVRNDGTVWTWGFNTEGQLGNGTFEDTPSVPIQVPGLSGFVQVDAANQFSIALKNDGTVWGWGYNVFFNLGQGSLTDLRYVDPVRVPGLFDILDIAAGTQNSLALDPPNFNGGSCNTIGGGSGSNNGNNATIEVAFTLCGGSLSIEAPDTITMSAIGVTGVQTTSAGLSGLVYFEDLRANEAGWSATVTMTNFVGQTNSSNIITLANSINPTVSYFRLQPNTLTEIAGGSLIGLTDYTSSQPTTALSSMDANGVSNPFSLATFSAGGGGGRYGKTIYIEQDIPAFPETDDYAATLTFSIS